MNKRKIKFIHTAFIILFFFIGCKVQAPKPVIDIHLPRIANYTIDGNPGEWVKIKAYRLWANPLGICGDSTDLLANLRVSWNGTSIVFLIEITDESFVYDTLSPWKGDAIEIFLSPYRGSADITHISLIPFPGNSMIRVANYYAGNDSGTISNGLKSFTSIKGNNRITEVEIPYLRNRKNEIIDHCFALQVYVDDSDTGSLQKNQLVWYPIGQTYSSSFSMFPVRLSEEKQSELKGSSRVIITDHKTLSLFVYGASAGDEIGIYRNGKFLRNYQSLSRSLTQPDTFDITSFGWDTENDSLFVTINGESLSLHELFLVPRLYKELNEKPFERDIRNFILHDRQSFPPENATLFIGSSSIVRWATLTKDFPELTVIQRGFGGSTSTDVLMYMNQIVLPYKPAKIVYYEGDNDIPRGLSSEEIRDNVKIFIEQVTAILPETRIYILSPKPSINRMYLWDKYKETQLLLRELAGNYNKVEYVDVTASMFNEHGSLNRSLFVEDGIHMNEKGYSIWTKIIRKALDLDE